MRFKLRMPFSGYRLSVSLRFEKNRQLSLEEQIMLRGFNRRCLESLDGLKFVTLEHCPLDYSFPPQKVLWSAFEGKSDEK